MAIILITHDLGVVADSGDRAIVMEQGRIVEEGSVEDFFHRPRHPYRQKLIESTPASLGPRAGSRDRNTCTPDRPPSGPLPGARLPQAPDDGRRGRVVRGGTCRDGRARR
ncbi:hypothetical protein [Streptomyces scabiei]|uniref:ABC transporter ATP-binding protein n=1 Tax=Streptomyces scabiei TaxID=1930 RepID=UPI0039F64BC0